jgi:hypothetical protein
MDNKFTVSIDEATGDTKFLVNDLSKGLLDSSSKVRRASHIVPCHWFLRLMFHLIRWCFKDESGLAQWTRNWNCRWYADLRPVGGPFVPVQWATREGAIMFEVWWLEDNFL